MTAQQRKDSMQMRIDKRIHALLLEEARRTHRTITGMLELIIEEYFNPIKAYRDKQKEGKDNE